MCCTLGALLIGAVAGKVAGDRDSRRSLVRQVVKGGMVAKRKLQAVGAAAVAETQKLVAEARSELDRTGEVDR
jgi:hypothetical protein